MFHFRGFVYPLIPVCCGCHNVLSTCIQPAGHTITSFGSRSEVQGVSEVCVLCGVSVLYCLEETL